MTINERVSTELVGEYAHVPGYAFFIKLTNALCCRTDWLKDEECRKIWQYVAYYNFVQDFVDAKSSIAPTWAMWRAVQLTFLQVVLTFEHDVILVLGFRLWNNAGKLPPEFPVKWCSITRPSGVIAYEPSIYALGESLAKAGGLL